MVSVLLWWCFVRFGLVFLFILASLVSCDPIPRATRDLNFERLKSLRAVIYEIRYCLPKEESRVSFVISLARKSEGITGGVVRVGSLSNLKMISPNNESIGDCITSKIYNLELRMRSLIDVDTFEVDIDYNKRILVFKEHNGAVFEFSLDEL